MIEKGERLIWSWLHLSDIHFEHGQNAYRADQKYVLNELLGDLVDNSIPKSVIPQAVVVTGDIAFSGGVRSNTEYGSAKEYLRRILDSIESPMSLPILMVPGNHDVQRSDEGTDAHSLITELRGAHLPNEIDRARADQDKSAILAARFSNYSQFARDIGAVNPDPVEWSWFTDTASGYRVRVMGWNTALLSNDDSDQGKLWVSREAIDLSLIEVDQSDLVLALSHHPFNWLSKLDAKYLENRSNVKVKVHLHGHVHEAANYAVRHGTGRGKVTITAGAAHGDAQSDPEVKPVPHHYSIGALVERADKGIEVRLYLRKWNEEVWVENSDLHSERGFAFLEVRPAPKKPRNVRTSASKKPIGTAIKPMESTQWLVPVVSAEGPQLDRSVDGSGRKRALMSPSGAILAQQDGANVFIATVGTLGSSSTLWQSPFTLGSDDRLVAVELSGVQDVLAVVTSATSSRIMRLEPSGKSSIVKHLAIGPLRSAVIHEGYLLTAALNGDVAECAAFASLADVDRLDAVARNGHTIVLATGRTHGSTQATYCLLSAPRFGGKSRLRRLTSGATGLGIDFDSREPVIVGESATRTWAMRASDSQFETYDKWLRL